MHLISTNIWKCPPNTLTCTPIKASCSFISKISGVDVFQKKGSFIQTMLSGSFDEVLVHFESMRGKI